MANSVGMTAGSSAMVAAPCVGCHYQAVCSSKRLACDYYYLYTDKHAKVNRARMRSIPDQETYALIFSEAISDGPRRT